MAPFFFFLFLFGCCIFTPVGGQWVDPEAYNDMRILLDFKNKYITDDPKNSLFNWTDQSAQIDQYCYFRGVRCGATKRVRFLYIQAFNLEGTIVDSKLHNLFHLSEINLANNRFMGPIPWGFGAIGINLIDFSNNMLTGRIPNDIVSCTRLKTLRLHHNQLSGKIIPFKSMFIQHVDISSNTFFGPIPRDYENYLLLETLLLNDNQLSGPIPEGLGSNEVLRSLDLSNNELTGHIPHAVANAPLTHFSVKNNKLGEKVPVTDAMKAFAPNAFLNNSDFCGPIVDVDCPLPPDKWKRILKIIIITCSVVGSVLLFLKSGIPQWLDRNKPIFYTKSNIRHFTDNFSNSNLLGLGALSTVYKGTLPYERTVAIKRVRPEYYDFNTHKFNLERRLLRQVEHPNLVKVINSCSNKNLKCLVMEYMENGSLDMQLHKLGGSSGMPWGTRMGIIAGVAAGLEHLHTKWHQGDSEVRCEVKATSVLLDDKMKPHLTDFRFTKYSTPARTFPEGFAETGFEGRIGYKAPG